MDYTKYNFSNSKAIGYDEGLRSYMLGVYNYMAAALILSGLMAMLAYKSPTLMSMMYIMKGNHIAGYSGFGYLIAFAPLGFVFAFANSHRMSSQTLQLVFWGYAAVMGLSLSSLLLMYTGESVIRVFFISASLFGGMSIYGYTTKKDLTTVGSYAMMAVWGIVIASVVNIFLKSPGMHYVMSFVSVIAFTALTAYDTQKIKELYYQSANGDQETARKVSIMGALTLYLDFINLFVSLLRFFGNRRED
jgi:FtsH-binding integral membrane protein